MATPSQATPSAGNTTQPKSKSKARNFQITVNQPEYYDNIKEYIVHLKSNNYFISCKEIAPSTGHEHIHIYAQFTTPISLSLKKLHHQHVEACRGTPQQNVDYIKKDGVILDEIGTVRKSGNFSIKDVEAMSIDEIKELPIQYKNITDKIIQEKANDIKISDIYKPNLKVVYIFGRSGFGKTRSAFKYIMDKYGDVEINMVKYENSFWTGVGKSKICVYDDFRDSHMRASEFINFIDYNIHTLNVKGSYVQNKYEVIIITSVQNPYDLYRGMCDNEPRTQWLRRMEIIELTEPESFDDE